jgi:uncharacterized tellurite resistance protein B-like protein
MSPTPELEEEKTRAEVMNRFSLIGRLRFIAKSDYPSASIEARTLEYAANTIEAIKPKIPTS